VGSRVGPTSAVSMKIRCVLRSRAALRAPNFSLDSFDDTEFVGRVFIKDMQRVRVYDIQP